MFVSITFKQMNSSDALKSYVQERLDRLDKLLDGSAEAEVVLSIDKIRQVAEVRLKSDKFQFFTREETDSMYASVDAATDKLKLQINKNKERLRKHLSGDKQTIRTE